MVVNVNNPLAEPKYFYQDASGRFWDANPLHDGMIRPKMVTAGHVQAVSRQRPVEIVQAEEPELTGQIQVEVMRQAHLRSIGLS